MDILATCGSNCFLSTYASNTNVFVQLDKESVERNKICLFSLHLVTDLTETLYISLQSK